MMRIRAIIFILVIVSVFFSLYQTYGNSRKDFTYIGYKKCEVCHGENAIGDQCGIWVHTGHAKAYSMLAFENSKKIGETVGVTDPQNDLKCLKCHTTGGGKVEHVKTEGVGCESCHGPGSDYSDLGIHVDYSDPTGVTGYMKALKFGMSPILGIVGKHLRFREKLCISCHRDERPCAPVDQKSKLKIKMTIQVIDKLERGDVKLKHPLRR